MVKGLTSFKVRGMHMSCPGNKYSFIRFLVHPLLLKLQALCYSWELEQEHSHTTLSCLKLTLVLCRLINIYLCSIKHSFLQSMIIHFCYWKLAHRRRKLWNMQHLRTTEATDLGAPFQGDACIRAGLFSCKPGRKKIVSSWHCAAHCCFQHEETARAGDLCLPVQKNVCTERSHLKTEVCMGCGPEGFCWSFRAAVFRKPLRSCLSEIASDERRELVIFFVSF